MTYLRIASLLALCALTIPIAASAEVTYSTIWKLDDEEWQYKEDRSAEGKYAEITVRKWIAQGDIPQEIFDHLAWTMPTPFPTNDFYLRFDTEGEPFEPEQFGLNEVLSTAAAAYAVDTLDFDVSLQDLMDSGWWPYDSFPEGTDMQQRIHGTKGGLIMNGSPEGGFQLFAGRSTPDWTAELKATILKEYYSAHLTGIDQAYWRQWTQQANTFVHPPIGPERMLPAFWTNPFTKEPMKESDSAGDYTRDSLSKWGLSSSKQETLLQRMERLGVTAEERRIGTTVPMMNWNKGWNEGMFDGEPEVQTNADYDSQYREQTRGHQQEQ